MAVSNSATVATPSDGLTTRTLGTDAIRATGVNAVAVS